RAPRSCGHRRAGTRDRGDAVRGPRRVFFDPDRAADGSLAGRAVPGGRERGNVMTEMRRSRSGRRLFVGGVVSMVASVAIVAGLLARKVSLVRAEGRARAADVAAGPHVRVARVTAPQGVQTLTPLGEARPDAAVAEANLKAIETLKSYEVIRAPFTGRVTARYADPGALMQNATSAQTGALPVLTVSETGRLRVYAYVDQQDAPLVGVGTPAEITSADRVAFRRVVVARDDGQSAQIAGGVAPGERVALNVGESVAEGARVQPVEQH